jgi:glucose-1-phosphate cytidylyltransferase
MNVVILAGGRGTRLAEETGIKPKPMVEIGGRPMLWHIMNIYAHFGHKSFFVACGYKGEIIKEYVNNFYLHNSDVVVNLRDGTQQVLGSHSVDWKIAAIDTGQDTMTGGRLRRLKHLLGREPFMLTYGDGLGDIDVAALLAFHKKHGKLATITAVRPPARFGELLLDGDAVTAYAEKPQTSQSWINGGFFVFQPEVLDLIADDSTVLERKPLERLANDRQLMAYHHDGFWQPMDTLREKEHLESLWAAGAAPWKIWA